MNILVPVKVFLLIIMTDANGKYADRRIEPREGMTLQECEDTRPPNLKFKDGSQIMYSCRVEDGAI